MRLSRVAAKKIHDHASLGRFFPSQPKLALGKVEAGDAIPSPGQFDGVAARAATDVQDGFGPIGSQFSLDEIHFADRSLRKTLLVIRLAEIGEERFVPLCHVGFLPEMPCGQSSTQRSGAPHRLGHAPRCQGSRQSAGIFLFTHDIRDSRPAYRN